MLENFQSKVLPIISKFMTLPSICALRDGMVAVMSLTVIGSMFLLLAEFPYEPVKVFFANTGLTPFMMQAFSACFNFLSLFVVFSIGYFYAKNRDVEALSSGILSLVAFLILIKHNITPIVNNKVEPIINNAISLDYTGSKGLVSAIIIGLIISKIYVVFIKKGIVIKMPEGVPPGVASSFAALIPGLVIIIFSALLMGISSKIYTDKAFIDVLYLTIQQPLQNISDSYLGIMFISVFVSFFWWFGVHGANIVIGIFSGVWLSNMLANQHLIDQGIDLTVANGGYIMTNQFAMGGLVMNITGSGITIGMAIAMLFRAKSKQFKMLGKLSIIPSIFNINEPLIFGTPIVMNPFLFLPFIAVPLICTNIAYFALKLGIVPLFSGIMPPWTTPAIISGYIAAGWKMALLQLIIILISIVIYYPFIMKLDKLSLQSEVN